MTPPTGATGATGPWNLLSFASLCRSRSCSSELLESERQRQRHPHANRLPVLPAGFEPPLQRGVDRRLIERRLEGPHDAQVSHDALLGDHALEDDLALDLLFQRFFAVLRPYLLDHLRCGHALV